MTNHEESRPAFEAFADAHYVLAYLSDEPSCEPSYRSRLAQDAWDAWRAALTYAASREPVAWLHILHFEPGAGDEQRLTFSPEHPFGKPGIDYSQEYKVTTIPLIATTPAASREPRWKPIETAPRDGTVILLCNEHGAWIGHWKPVYQSGYKPSNPWASLMLNHDHMPRVITIPTHWMPLPPAPAAGGA